jgi:hypothetical protein
VTDTIHIGTVPKNGCEEVRVSLSHCAGHALVDVRCFAEFGDAPERRATRKGICLKISRLPDLINALVSAEAEARARGLLTGEGDR